MDLGDAVKSTDASSTPNPGKDGGASANPAAGATDTFEGFHPETVTHLLCHTQKSDTYKRAIESRKVRCVTAYWLNDVLTHKKMSQVSWLFH